MLEKTEGAINNGQSRDTGNIRHTGHETKTNKKHNTENKKMNNTNTVNKPVVHTCARK